MATFQPIVFGKYTLLERIGVDPMAEVYRASHVGRQGKPQPVLIKKFLPHVTKNTKLMESFSNTARVTSLFDQRNIAGVIDFGSVEDAFYIATEYLSGHPLRHLLSVSRERQRAFSPQHALHIATDICRALDYAHEFKDPLGRYATVIHGNLSPESVFITFDGTVKLTDFGIHGGNTRETGGQPEGLNTCLAYMSPEQITGDPCDCRTDIFSTGILLYEMLTGRRMFQGKSMEIFSRVRHARFEPVEKVAPHLSPEVRTILGHCLQKAPDDRYASAKEMLKALEGGLSGLPKPTFDRGLTSYFDSPPTGQAPKEANAGGSAVKTASSPPQETRKTVTAKAGEKRHKETLKVPPSPGAGPRQKPAATTEEGPRPEPAAVAEAETGTSTGSTARTWFVALPVALAVAVAIFWVFRGNVDQDGSSLRADMAIERALQALDEGKFTQAISGFERALATRPQDRDQVIGPYAQALEGRAGKLLKTDPAAAESLLLQARELAPERVGIHATLGLLYLNRKDYPEAAAAYQRAIRLDPRMADLFFNLGYIYAIQKNYSKAHKMYARTVELAPAFMDEALFNLAMIEARLGKHQNSVKNLKRALEYNPENEQVKEYLKRLET